MKSGATTINALHDAPALSALPGLAALAVATLLTSLAGTLPASAARLVFPLLSLCALLQIVSGLNEWRSQRHYISILLVAFGLLTCAEMSLLHGAIPNLSAGSLLLFWAVFATLLAAHADHAGRPFQLLLYALGLNLSAKALFLLSGYDSMRVIALLCAVAAAVATAALIRRILALRNEIDTHSQLG